MNPVELIQYARKVRDEQKLDWVTLVVPRRKRRGRRVQVIPGCRGEWLGDHEPRDGQGPSGTIVSVQISELLTAAAKLADTFEAVAVWQAEHGQDAEAEESMRMYVALKDLLHDVPTTKIRPKKKVAKAS